MMSKREDDKLGRIGRRTNRGVSTRIRDTLPANRDTAPAGGEEGDIIAWPLGYWKPEGESHSGFAERDRGRLPLGRPRRRER
jgi:hypothetical protein